MRVQGKASVMSVVVCVAVRGENKQKKAQVFGLADSEQRTLWTSNSSLQVHPLLRVCVCVISAATDGAVNVCVIEERGDRKCVGPRHTHQDSLFISLFLHPTISPLLFLFRLFPHSVGSISEAAGAARREQVAAFKVVKTTESRKKRTGLEKCVCVCVCVRDRERKTIEEKLKGTKKRRKGKDRQGTDEDTPVCPLSLCTIWLRSPRGKDGVTEEERD